LTRWPLHGYRMGMVGRSAIGSRLVVLVTVAATLLASWVPLARACACMAAPVSGTAAGDPEPAAVCQCCGQRAASDQAPRACCPLKADHSGGAKPCDCGPVSGPADSAPTAPPRPADTDDSLALTVAAIAPVAGIVPVRVGPTAAERAAHLADQPPTDLVTSLSRLTC
jgi:hypothetical protein